MLNCLVNDVNVSFEVDSGSFLSTINESELNKIKNVHIFPSFKKAKGYSNNVIQFKGEVELSVMYKGYKVNHKFQIVNHNSISLFGRDLCKKFDINILIPDVNSVHNIPCNVLNKYKHYLSDTFKSCVKDTIYTCL